MATREVAIVTGGSSGIGAVTSDLLASAGYDLVLVARDLDRLEARANEVARHGGAVSSVAVDLRLSGAADEVAERTVERYGRVDVFIHSAGDAVSGTVEDLDDGAWTSAFDLKLGAAVRLTRAVVDPLRRSPHGAIVYVAGGAGLRPGPRHAAVGAVNAALLNLTRSTALHLAGDGIRVNAVAPGPVRTPRWDRLLAQAARATGEGPAEIERQAEDAIPLGSIASAEEVAAVVSWLVSPGASQVTGVVVPVDGGASIA